MRGDGPSGHECAFCVRIFGACVCVCVCVCVCARGGTRVLALPQHTTPRPLTAGKSNFALLCNVWRMLAYVDVRAYVGVVQEGTLCNPQVWHALPPYCFNNKGMHHEHLHFSSSPSAKKGHPFLFPQFKWACCWYQVGSHLFPRPLPSPHPLLP